jgi:nucleotide-binding universal stress UspA family protein
VSPLEQAPASVKASEPGILSSGRTPTEPLRLLVAVAASAEARAIGRVASAIACQKHASVRVLSVVSAAPEDLSAKNRSTVHGWTRDAARKRVVSRALGTACPAAALWPVTVGAGDVVSVIVSETLVSNADLLVIGLPEPRQNASLRDNVVKRLLRRVSLPVLAVVSKAVHQPRVVVAGVDFTRASLHAARAALRIMAPGGVLHLVHVQPEFGTTGSDGEGLRAIYMQGLGGAFERVRSALAPPADIAVETVLLDGSPIAELTAYAARVNADLVAVGSHRLDLAAANVGRLPTALLRDGSRSALIAPPVGACAPTSTRRPGGISA